MKNTLKIDVRSRFESAVQEQFGFSSSESAKIYEAFKQAKVLKVDGINGSYTLAHGAFWDKDVMLTALEQ